MAEPRYCFQCNSQFVGDYSAHVEHHCTKSAREFYRGTFTDQGGPGAFIYVGVGLWLREFLQAADAELEGNPDLVFADGQRPAHAIAFIGGNFCFMGRELFELQDADFDKRPKQLVAEIKALLDPEAEFACAYCGEPKRIHGSDQACSHFALVMADQPNEQELLRRCDILDMVFDSIPPATPQSPTLCRDQTSDRVCKLPAGHLGNHSDGQGQWVDSFMA